MTTTTGPNPRFRWIICEARARWASALRVALAHEATRAPQPERIHEVRLLSDARLVLADAPCSLLAVEVERENLAGVLAELPPLLEQFPGCRAAALLGTSLATTHSGAEDSEGLSHARGEVARALREAGALEVATSPRGLAEFVALGRRLAARRARHPALAAQNRSFADEVWAVLPWQPANRPLGLK